MGIFDPEHKTNAHIFELLLIMGAVGLTVGRMIRADMPMTRADTIALGMVSERAPKPEERAFDGRRYWHGMLIHIGHAW